MKDEAVLDFMTSYESSYGRPPTMMEICAGCGFHYRSHARYYILKLVSVGLLVRVMPTNCRRRYSAKIQDRKGCDARCNLDA
jgi:hypothetical protein